MTRTVNLAIAERNQKLLEDYRANRFQEYRELGAKHGMSAQSVFKILSEAGETRADRKKPRLKRHEKRSLSVLHTTLGSIIHQLLMAATLDEHDTVNFQIGGYAHDLKMSPQRFGGILVGVEDITLSELMRITARIKVPVAELISKAAKQEANLWKSKPESSG